MALKTVFEVNHVSSDGDLVITMNLFSQDLYNNTSQVNVVGRIKNVSNHHIAHNTPDVTCYITGDQFFRGDEFGFNLSPPNQDTEVVLVSQKEFINHTFTVHHDDNGDHSSHFSVTYGPTGTSEFGGDRFVDATMSLPNIKQPPSKPGRPSVSDILATSATVTWTGSTDDGGSNIKDYILRIYKGSSASGAHDDRSGLGTTRHLGGLTPGQTYTLTVVAVNSSKINGGLSDPSASRTFDMLPGLYIRVAGEWVHTVAYVRSAGIWKQATPYVRSGGSWKITD